MSLTSYQAAPPRVFTYADADRESKLKKRSLVRSISGINELASGIGFGGPFPYCLMRRELNLPR